MPQPFLAGLRVLYLGTPEFAVKPLEALHAAGATIVCVVSSPDQPAGRGLKMRTPAVAEAARRLDLPLLQPVSLKAPEFLEQVRLLAPELGVVVAFRMLPRALWAIPTLGFFNIHAALLPAYRGAAPINWAIINGETTTGVTSFLLDDHMDTGQTLLQSPTPLGPDTTAGALHDILADLGAKLAVETAYGLQHHALTPKPQPDVVNPPLAPKFYRNDMQIHWSATAQHIHNLVRGLAPAPSAWTHLSVDGKQLDSVKIHLTRPVAEEHLPSLTPGECRFEGDSMRLLVGCGQDTLIEILTLQLPGKRALSAAEFQRGYGNRKLLFY